MRNRVVYSMVALTFITCSPKDTGRDCSLATLRIETASERYVSLCVEVADSTAERQRGLMGRERLPELRGMAFLFDEPTDGGFWMKDTLIPLSIAFWNQQGKIVEILDMRPCTTGPCPIYVPGATYVGAVEVNLGLFDRLDVEIGDRIEIDVSN